MTDAKFVMKRRLLVSRKDPYESTPHIYIDLLF